MDFLKTTHSSYVDKHMINYLWDYHAKNRGYQDHISEEILLLKNLHHKAPFDEETKKKVNMFAGTFIKHFAKKLPSNYRTYIYCAVPSHRSGTENKNGIYMLSRWTGVIRDLFNKDILVRHTDIEPLHSGGNRDIEVHLSSIKVAKIVYGKKIVVMDDVTTTGHSLEACKILLERAGAKEVIVMSFGRTTTFSNEYF